MANIISSLLFVVTILDLYYNFNAKEFPDYHQKRILSDIFNLVTIFLLPIFLVLFICFMGCLSNSFDNKLIQCCTGMISLFFLILEFIFAISSFLIQAYSIYLYFVYDGSSKIQNPIIKVLMWITFINLVINIILSFFTKKKNENANTNTNEEELVEV